MKRKMINLLTAALVCAGLLTFAGCGEKDPYTVYEEASAKTSALKSLAAAADMNMKLTAEGQSMEIGIDTDMKILNPDTEDMQADIAMNVDMLGQTLTLNSYYKDGYYYTASDASKIKYPMDIKEMQKQLTANSIQTGLKKEDFKEITMEKKDKDYLLTFTIKGETMSSMVDSALGALSDMIASNNMDMKIGDIPGTATVNKDNYITAMTMKLPLTLTMAGQEMTMDMDMDMSYSDPGKEITLEFPDDLDTYEEVDINAGAATGSDITGSADGDAAPATDGDTDAFSDNSQTEDTEGTDEETPQDSTTKDAA